MIDQKPVYKRVALLFPIGTHFKDSGVVYIDVHTSCLLYTSDAADERK